MSNQFKVNRMSQGGYDVAYGSHYFTYPGAPDAATAATAAMQAIISENPTTMPIDLVKSMSDPSLRGAVVQRWTALSKTQRPSGPVAQQASQARIQAQPQADGRLAKTDVPRVTREQAMAFLQYRIEELHKADVNRDQAMLQKTAKGYGGSMTHVEGAGSVNAMLKNLNTTYIRLSIMPAEIAAAAPAAMAQGQVIPTPQQYFEEHPMYPALAVDTLKWLRETGGV